MSEIEIVDESFTLCTFTFTALSRSKVWNYCEGYLPAPGPPIIKTTVTFLLSNIGMDSVASAARR
jgi:hypothetical protein